MQVKKTEFSTYDSFSIYIFVTDVELAPYGALVAVSSVGVRM